MAGTQVAMSAMTCANQLLETTDLCSGQPPQGEEGWGGGILQKAWCRLPEAWIPAISQNRGILWHALD